MPSSAGLSNKAPSGLAELLTLGDDRYKARCGTLILECPRRSDVGDGAAPVASTDAAVKPVGVST